MIAEELNVDEEVVSKDFTNKFEYGWALRQCTKQFGLPIFITLQVLSQNDLGGCFEA